MKSVLTTLCKGQPSRWPRYIKPCQRILNSAVHETTGEQPHYLMFNRRAPRRIGAELPQIDRDRDIATALEIVKRTNQERADKWRAKANKGRKDQKVEMRDYTTSASDRKLGVKWIGSYRVLEVIRGGGAHVLENTFDGTRVQRAADKVRLYVRGEEVLE